MIDRSYTVEPESNVFNFCTYQPLSTYGPDNLGLFPTLEEAKVACQSDHDRRIEARLDRTAVRGDTETRSATDAT